MLRALLRWFAKNLALEAPPERLPICDELERMMRRDADAAASAARDAEEARRRVRMLKRMAREESESALLWGRRRELAKLRGRSDLHDAAQRYETEARRSTKKLRKELTEHRTRVSSLTRKAAHLMSLFESDLDRAARFPVRLAVPALPQLTPADPEEIEAATRALREAEAAAAGDWSQKERELVEREFRTKLEAESR